MRNLLPIQCGSPGCGRKALVGGRCPVHSPAWVGAGRSYGSAWPKIRAAHLQAEPGCRQCGRPAVTVDHVLPKAFGGTDDEHNLQSLCARHAHEKNVRDAAEGKRRARGEDGRFFPHAVPPAPVLGQAVRRSSPEKREGV